MQKLRSRLSVAINAFIVLGCLLIGACIFKLRLPQKQSINPTVSHCACLTSNEQLEFSFSPAPAVLPLSEAWRAAATARSEHVSHMNFSASCKGDCALTQEHNHLYSEFNETLAVRCPSGGAAACDLAFYDGGQACECLSQFNTILAFGDSLMRRIMAPLMTDNAMMNRYEKETRSPENEIVLEEAALLPCEHIGARTRVFKLTAWLFPHLKQKVEPVLDGFHREGRPVDLLLIGFGVHNTWSGNSTEYEANVEHTISVLSLHPALSSARVVWMLPHFTDVSRLTFPVNTTKHYAQNERFRLFNDAVLRVVAEKAPRWTALDFFDLTRNRLHLAQDAMHFHPLMHRWKNQVLYNALC